MQPADALSKLSSVIQEDEISLDLHVNHAVFSDTQLPQIHMETKNWLVLSIVYRLTCHLRPDICIQVPRMAHRYWDMRHELTADSGLLLKTYSIVIPTVLRDSFLHDLHRDHTDVTKCLLLAC